MDEREFQQVREHLSQRPCPYQKAILSGLCRCRKCQRLNIAEREMVDCISPIAHGCCVKVLEQLSQKARFAIKQVRSPLSHIQAMKVQCGGLIGLQSLLISGNTCEIKSIKNIDALVTQALEVFGNMENFPYQEIVRFISHYQVRVKRVHH